MDVIQQVMINIPKWLKEINIYNSLKSITLIYNRKDNRYVIMENINKGKYKKEKEVVKLPTLDELEVVKHKINKRLSGRGSKYM